MYEDPEISQDVNIKFIIFSRYIKISRIENNLHGLKMSTTSIIQNVHALSRTSISNADCNEDGISCMFGL